MIKEKILSAYEELAERYNALIDQKPHNAYYDRPNTLSLLPGLEGKQVLDAACGPGKYAEIMLDRGAMVTGFDLSPNMVALARTRNAGRGEFFVHDLSSRLDRYGNNSFDIVLCALALEYLEDWTVPMQEFHRVLRADGMLVLSFQHPFFDYNYYGAANYFVTEQVSAVWGGFGKPVEVNCYRRSLQDCLSPITENGFYLDKLLEPRPTPEFEQADPRHYRELNKFPGFMCIRAIRRPG